MQTVNVLVARMKTLIGVCVFAAFLAIASAVEGSKCTTSYDCRNSRGREICIHQLCRGNIKCRNDNDCFFRGAADIYYGRPHPVCYDYSRRASKTGTGICMLREYADHRYQRLMGQDTSYVSAQMRKGYKSG